MSQLEFTRCWMISRHFDAWVEEYLLRDLWRWDWADSTLHRTEVQNHEAKVMIKRKEIGQEWLTITGVVADALTDGQIIYTSYKKSDGSFQDAEILQVKKWDGETCLYSGSPKWFQKGLEVKINPEKIKKQENHERWKEQELNVRQSQVQSQNGCRG